jgi:folate-binding Fe-S cluster repair protein YgfZ
MSTIEVVTSDAPFAWSRIVAQGPDALSFLQGQLSQDLSELTDAGSWSLLLAPNSDVMATVLVRALDDGYEILVARDVADVALARLKRFLLRVQCTLHREDDVTGPFDTVSQQIEAGEPGPHEFLGLTPQTYGENFVTRTVSFTKGCFTGQELVGRLDARGSSVPWRFVRATGPSVQAIDDVLQSVGPDGPKGVTSAVLEDGVVHALGFAHRSFFASSPTHNNTIDVQLIA